MNGWMIESPDVLSWVSAEGIPTIVEPGGAVTHTDIRFDVSGASLDEPLPVTVPNPDGTLSTYIHVPATVKQWNAAVAAHQRQWRANAQAAGRNDIATNFVIAALVIGQWLLLAVGATHLPPPLSVICTWAVGIESFVLVITAIAAASSNGSSTAQPTSSSGISPIVTGLAGFAIGEYVASHHHRR